MREYATVLIIITGSTLVMMAVGRNQEDNIETAKDDCECHSCNYIVNSAWNLLEKGKTIEEIKNMIHKRMSR